jgi:uncharacterized glyoxalase superfamily protein PhnB
VRYKVDRAMTGDKEDRMNLSPYLNFPGNTEVAMKFYEKALGGKLTEIHRFGTMPGAKVCLRKSRIG